MRLYDQPHVFHWLLAVVSCCLISPQLASAQNVNVATPFGSNGDGYYENLGVGFGFTIPGGRGPGSRIVGLNRFGQLTPNINFQNGGFGVSPRFGGFNPNAGGSFGYGNFGPRGGGYSLGLNFAKGSTRTNVTSAPSVTVQNGFGGSIASGSFRPFVVGTIPIVGGSNSNYLEYYQPDNGVTRALQSGQLDLSQSSPSPESVATSRSSAVPSVKSSAQTGDLSVKQIKAARARRIAAEKARLESTLQAAANLEAERRFSEARSQYRAALQLTDDKQIKAEIKALIKASKLK